MGYAVGMQDARNRALNYVYDDEVGKTGMAEILLPFPISDSLLFSPSPYIHSPRKIQLEGFGEHCKR